MRRILHILVLILAGEMIFSLPFHTARFFRPTLLEAFGFSNTAAGRCIRRLRRDGDAGLFPGRRAGRPLPARKLMRCSLLATAAVAFTWRRFPGSLEMSLLYGYWGVTTILLFWGALIRATRDWGGHRSQGLAFGILDGGRGLVAAGVAMTAVTVLSLYLPLDGLLDAGIGTPAGIARRDPPVHRGHGRLRGAGLVPARGVAGCLRRQAGAACRIRCCGAAPPGCGHRPQ